MRNSASAVLVVAAVAALGTGLLFSLGGCVQQPRAIIPTASPSVAPVFKSDADALAAAKKTYDGYLAATAAIGGRGGADPGKIALWVTDGELAVELKQFQQLENSGEHFEGTSTYSSFRLQQWSQSSSGNVTLAAYACDDVSRSRLIDKRGRDITPISRENVIPVSVQFESSPNTKSTLVIGGSTPWSGTDFC